MNYIKLGNTDLQVSRIALGTWAIGESLIRYRQVKQASATIEAALDLGINFIDTSPLYGNGLVEQFLGKTIRRNRDKLIIATKCGIDPRKGFTPNLSPKFIKQEIEQSLKNLKTDCIDLYLCHCPDPKTPAIKTIYTLKKLQKLGLIKYFGISNFSKTETAEALRYGAVSANQVHYSLLERTIEKDLLPFCSRNQIAVIAYGVLHGGLLNLGTKSLPILKKNDVRYSLYEGFNSKHWHKTIQRLTRLTNIAKRHKCSPAGIAIAWALLKSSITTVLIGASRTNQVIEDTRSLEISLTNSEIQALELLSEKH